MEKIAATDVVDLDSILAYAGRLSFVFHRYRLLSTENEYLIPSVVEEHISLLSSTIGTLNEVLGLLKREDAGKTQNHVFSDDGLQFVNFLVGECAKVLDKIAPTATKAAQKVERKKTRKTAKKAKENIIAPVVPTQLKLDEEKFLNDLETAVWYRVDNDTYAYLERFKEIQLHLLLVYQVVTVGSLLGDLRVDIEKVVLYHERINRTFDLVCGSSPSRRRNFRSSSSSAYTLSGSDSDSEAISVISRRRGNPRPNFVTYCPPPPPTFPPVDRCRLQPASRVINNAPPPPPVDRCLSQPSLRVNAPPPPPPAVAFMSRSLISNSTSSPRVIDLTTPHAKPPSYESHRVPTTPPLKQALPLTNPPTSSQLLSDEKGQDNKAESLTETVKEQLVKKPAEPRVPEGQLFKSPHDCLSFKIRSLFRSKESLAAEMRKVLESTSSGLDAFLIQGYDIRPIPHSAFHSLEATHMRTILSQLNDNSWLETFSSLTRSEHSTLGIALCPFGQTKLRREVVVLKVLQENKNNVWMRLIANKSVTPILPQNSNGRIILAIVREHLDDGKRISPIRRGTVGTSVQHFPVPPTPPGFSQSGPPPPGVLSVPPHPPPRGTLYPPPPPAILPTIRPPPMTTPRGFSSPPPPPPPTHPAPKPHFNSSEAQICSNAEALVALTTYAEYTLRQAEPNEPSLLRTWFKITITHEYNTIRDIVARVESFNKRGGSVINSQLRLTDQQATHMTKIFEDLQMKERDHRFEWCWVELSLHNSIGEVDLAARGHAAQTATMMHLIARRSLKREYKPYEVYNWLVRGPPRPGFNNGLPPRPGPPVGILLPMPGPPPPPPPPQPRVAPPVFVDRFRPRPRGNGRAKGMSMGDPDDSGGSGSDSDTTYDSRDRRVRRTRCNDKRMGRRYFDSEISDDSDDEEDAIKIPIILKRGDDVVKKLLDLWTPNTGNVEKSMGRVSESS
ncbi:uncharacterized protein Bfra_004349 [Botrytis fragariae]|uniref:Uncharacterized protein n=1 Tax=Botrytis fragariae TaxID=1964551 RepID=A0A8H6AVB8_9HELO|nr:uncharacterized protein Bfra_004349 [Botrytis fragariae]KAF5874344.1 hypothetical protein Bfra_004349 [Botrytis fragariae]